MRAVKIRLSADGGSTWPVTVISEYDNSGSGLADGNNSYDWTAGVSVLRSNLCRMEVSSELIAETKRNNLKLTEVPIKAIYTEYSLSKGQSFFVGIKTLFKLIFRRITM